MYALGLTLLSVGQKDEGQQWLLQEIVAPMDRDGNAIERINY